MYGLNTFALLIVIGILYFVSIVSKEKEYMQNRIILVLSILLISINGYMFYLRPKEIPVEFSTITYFVSSVIFILRIKYIEIWAVYSAVMAGVFYYLTVLVTGGNTYEFYSHSNVYIALFSHGSLLFMGLLKLKTTKYNQNLSFVIIIGNLLILAWALYIRPAITYNERIFIYELIDGKYLNQLDTSFIFIIKPVYYILVSFFVYKSSKVIFKVNEKLYLNDKRDMFMRQEKKYDSQSY
ncbi:hypothetical protein CI105_08265 [Candidatus Izimaplasma bacterium ZiA1]|uniref:hypothetical protein n=1 Tax=Candidatus Izimoplasma sp. ZiA1 TaxID=2024899 RepID=UPI000BAA5BC5|nr:hypothetical protein CI105_08265 [Candidatus Izimaplasma bacterium ZiA1]